MSPVDTKSPPEPSASLNTFILAALLLVSFIVAFYPVMKNLVLTWYNNEDYSQGFLVLPLAVFLVLRKGSRLAEIKHHPSIWGLSITVGGLFLYLLAYYAEISTLSSFCIIVVLSGIIIYLYGFRILRELLFPIFLLVFMIPVPSQIFASFTGPLQLIVSKVSVILAGLMGIPIHRAGNVIYLPNKTLEVVRACSGLRSILSILFVSTVFAYLSLKSNLLRTALALCGIPAAIVVNIFRILCVICAFYYFGLDLSTGTYHTALGAGVYLLVLLLIGFTRWIFLKWDVSAE